MDESYLEILVQEFNAWSDSFLIQLRIDLEWDKKAFNRLTEAMGQCCKYYQQLHAQLALEQPEQFSGELLEDQQLLASHVAHQKSVLLPVWLAEGFWYLSTFVKDHTSHPAWQNTIAAEPEYYEKAYERLESLASWFFTGQCPWIDEENGWASTFVEE